MSRELQIYPSSKIKTSLFTDEVNDGRSTGHLMETHNQLILDCEIVNTGWTHGFCGITFSLADFPQKRRLSQYEYVEIRGFTEQQVRDTTLVYLINDESNEEFVIPERANVRAIAMGTELATFNIPIDSFYVPSWWLNNNPEDPYLGGIRLNNVSAIRVSTGDNTTSRKAKIIISSIRLHGRIVSPEQLYFTLLVVLILLTSTHALVRFVALRKVSIDSQRKALALQQVNAFLRIEKDKFESMATRDPLTNALNRAGLSPIMQRVLQDFRKKKTKVSLILFDIDNFKALNDNYGHDFGDFVLSEMSAIISSKIRSSDHLARWGGEEFAIICSEAGVDAGMVLAEKLRIIIEEAQFKDVQVTCSFGVSELSASDVESWFKSADIALYQAKRNGKNKVVNANEVEEVKPA